MLKLYIESWKLLEPDKYVVTDISSIRSSASALDVMDCSRGIIELGDVTVHNVKQLKRLNQAIFPVIYNDKFYKDVLQFGELVKLGMYKNVLLKL